MKSRDKDYRYMATSDLIVELESDTFNIDSGSQRKLVEQVLLLLDDNSNDVQEIAAKWFVTFGCFSLQFDLFLLSTFADCKCFFSKHHLFRHRLVVLTLFLLFSQLFQIQSWTIGQKCD